MVPTKEMSHLVPIGVDEIVEEVHAAYEEGITLVHLHARDEKGEPTYKNAVYIKIVDGIRKYCPSLVICISLSGRNFNEFEKRSEPLELYPDMGSLTLSSLNFAKQASINSPDMIQALLEKMNSYGVSPELEVFDLGMINYGKYLEEKKMLNGPLYFNIIFGNIAGMQADLSSMAASLQALPRDANWAFGGLGPQQLIANTVAIAMGGGVRIGLEDNLFFDKAKNVKASNIDLIKRVKALASVHERSIMNPTEFGNLGFYNKKR